MFPSLEGSIVYNLQRLVAAAAAAANPAPMDASDMSFDEDDLLDVFTHHRMKAEKRSGSVRLRLCPSRETHPPQARF